MKKILVFTGLITPVITYAAWWNPASWFGHIPQCEPVIVKEIVEVEKIVEVPVYATTTATTTEYITVEKPVEITKEVIKEVPVEKIVEKIVTEDNPELLARISELEAENNSLQSHIVNLENTIRVIEDTKITVSNIKVEPSINGVFMSWESNIPTSGVVFIETIGLSPKMYNFNRVPNKETPTYDVGIQNLHTDVEYTYTIQIDGVGEYEGTFIPHADN